MPSLKGRYSCSQKCRPCSPILLWKRWLYKEGGNFYHIGFQFRMSDWTLIGWLREGLHRCCSRSSLCCFHWSRSYLALIMCSIGWLCSFEGIKPLRDLQICIFELGREMPRGAQDLRIDGPRSLLMPCWEDQIDHLMQQVKEEEQERTAILRVTRGHFQLRLSHSQYRGYDCLDGGV